MAALFGTIEQFDSNESSFEQYVERLEFYFEANEVQQENKKKAVFLSVVGPAHFSLLRDLIAPETTNKKTYSELVDTLKRHFDVTPSKFLQRGRFEMRVRQPGESVNAYIAALRKLAQQCDFGSTLEDRLCERLVRGMNEINIQRKLLSTAKLSLQSAVEIAQAMEMTDKWANEMASGAEEEPMRLNFQSDPSCYRCGGTHYATKCKFANTICNFCKKTGHLARVCKRKRKEVVQDRKRSHQGLMEAENDQGEQFGLYTITSEVNPMTINLKINGRDVMFHVDTGATVSVMSNRDYTKFVGKSLQRSNIRLKTFTGEKLNVLGERLVEVMFKDQKLTLPLAIVDGLGPPLLGRNWITQLNPKWMTMFMLQEVKPGTRDKLEQIIASYKSVFDDEAGCLKEHQVKLHLKNGAVPRFVKARHPPFALREGIEQEIRRLENNGIIEKVEFSDWATPIVPILKHDSNIRICGDFKVTVNKSIFIDQHPIPKLEELCAKLSKGKKFSRIDLSHAYTQLELHPDSRDLTTINTHCGLYRYKRLCFGIAAAPAIFQRTIENVFREVKDKAIYIDDLIVTGETDEIHLQNLQHVLQICKDKGLTIKEKKCEFFKEEINFLGYRLNAQGLQPLSEKIRAVHDAPEPRNISELKSYIGMLNYYAKYIHNLSHQLAPLYDLLKKDKKWQWGKEQEKAFKQSKTLLTSDLILVHFDPTKPLILACDASPRGIAAILSHVEKDGSERPIAYASRLLSRAEQNYSQIDREALAIIFGTTRFHKYVYGKHVKIITDHKPLLGLFGHEKAIPEKASSRVIRWAVTLSAYTYELVYRAGSSNNADALSRLPIPVRSEEEQIPQDVFQVFASIDSSPVTSKMIAEETKRERILSRVYNFTLHGWPEKMIDENLRPYFCRKAEISIDKGCLLWGTRVIIPSSLRQRLMDLLHEEHIGIVRMKAQARAYIWWPQIDMNLERTVKTCCVCQENRNAPPHAPLHPWNWPQHPWSRLHLDFAGPICGKMFLIIADAHSKWIDVRIMNRITSAQTILQLRHVFAVHGLPDTVVTDNGPSFSSREFSTFLTYNGVQHIRTSPFHPASNGFAERCVQTFKAALKTITSGTLEERVLRFLTRYRSTPQCTTGVTPAELLFNRKMKTRLDLVHPFINDNVSNSQARQKLYHDSTSSDRDIGVRDNVYVRNYGEGKRWVPGVVTDQTGPVSFKVRTSKGIERRHQDQLRSTECVWDDEIEVEGPQENADQNSPSPDVSMEVTEDVTGTTDGPGERKSTREKRPVRRLITEI